ncbi:ADP-forming succinate--CoA ligase subunit beta [Prolixibacter denitrificans]|uniref:Succinate--CoA ligase [ADP-forming] subunit beta n=1 Tax=Prolixibacter denitrificans TaxID=1541063 RepID=A0A2P8CH96_9BACT|nr:ADP-forming succinate--CoA ligase subunit beta [Prolixibacter denitrificans]PSK84331.1 succinyl-CoA synthetase beta subunit [Prolixibacter denitrificans]GET20507.1 succinate--CoA ligase [ADP-forming] subunit beta [Prolixibacter denitrificans]
MKIHEYQAKQIFADYEIPVSDEILCHSVEDVEKAADKLGLPVVVKAQVLAGGRGKAGGVKLAKTKEELVDAANQILGMDIKGYTVEKVLTAKAISFTDEFYVGLTIDRNTKSVVFMASAEGGVEIEEVAKDNPDAIHKFVIDAEIGLMPFQARQIAFKLFDDIKLVRQGADLFEKLYRVFMDTDASLAEINPLVITADGNLMALDGKMNFDDNALFRQAEILEMREPTEDEKTEIEAKEKGLSFIKLDGNIGCMVNGAGLAMATMDIIKIYGGEPANFLDIGGSSNPQKVIDAMNLLLADKNVKAVMINIFGGITRCDDVAKGIISALDQMNINIPIVVRLSGTNAAEGLEILKKTNLVTVASMGEAAEKAIEMASQTV